LILKPSPENSFLSYTVKDIPGINPEIFTQLMSSCCIFMTMSDMSKELPEITESVISSELDSSIKKSYEDLLDSSAFRRGDYTTAYVETEFLKHWNQPKEK